MDFIEYIAINCQDIISRSWHRFFQHDHLGFDDETYETGDRFRAEINNAFVKTGLLYTLTEAPYIERITDNSVLTMEIEQSVTLITYKGTRKLAEEAIALFKQPRPDEHRTAPG